MGIISINGYIYRELHKRLKIRHTTIWNQIYVSPGDPTKFFHVLNKPKPGLMSALPAV